MCGFLSIVSPVSSEEAARSIRSGTGLGRRIPPKHRFGAVGNDDSIDIIRGCGKRRCSWFFDANRLHERGFEPRLLASLELHFALDHARTAEIKEDLHENA